MESAKDSGCRPTYHRSADTEDISEIQRLDDDIDSDDDGDNGHALYPLPSAAATHLANHDDPAHLRRRR